MLNMMDHCLVPVLPVHDSFLVRAGYIGHLESEMQDAFKAVTGRNAIIKLAPSKPPPRSEVTSADGVVSVPRSTIDDLFVSSCFMQYTRSRPDGFVD